VSHIVKTTPDAIGIFTDKGFLHGRGKASTIGEESILLETRMAASKTGQWAFRKYCFEEAGWLRRKSCGGETQTGYESPEGGEGEGGGGHQRKRLGQVRWPRLQCI